MTTENVSSNDDPPHWPPILQRAQRSRLLRARAARQGRAFRARGNSGVRALRVPGVLAGIDLVAAGNGGLLRASRDRIYDRQLPRGAVAGDRASSPVQQLHDLDGGNGPFPRRNGDVGLYAVALQGTHPEHLVFAHLHLSLRALCRLGAAALFRYATARHLRHLLGTAVPPRRRPHLLLLLDRSEE